jgi:hypothetical protein
MTVPHVSAGFVDDRLKFRVGNALRAAAQAVEIAQRFGIRG